MITNNIGNILRIVHETNCSLSIAEEALKYNNEWSKAFKYAREH